MTGFEGFLSTYTGFHLTTLSFQMRWEIEPHLIREITLSVRP